MNNLQPSSPASGKYPGCLLLYFNQYAQKNLSAQQETSQEETWFRQENAD